MILERLPEVAALSADEKLQLIRELYDVLEVTGETEPNPSVVAELHQRRDEYLRDPSRAVTWTEVKRKLADGAWRK